MIYHLGLSDHLSIIHWIRRLLDRLSYSDISRRPSSLDFLALTLQTCPRSLVPLQSTERHQTTLWQVVLRDYSVNPSNPVSPGLHLSVPSHPSLPLSDMLNHMNSRLSLPSLRELNEIHQLLYKITSPRFNLRYPLLEIRIFANNPWKLLSFYRPPLLLSQDID